MAQFKTVEDLRRRLASLGLSLPIDDAILSAAESSPLAEPLQVGSRRAGNRWCIHPMEGWDARDDGFPSEHTRRRWRHFGLSGAKWIWGGEAAAVRPDGRANPRQLLATPAHLDGLRALRQELLDAHQAAFGAVDDLLLGLQLTHSGRFARSADDRPAPRIAYHHPLLDARVGVAGDDEAVVWRDDELDRLADDFLVAAKTAQKAGFHFVDVKACHGYLLHELLSARARPGPYGGDLTGRSRFLLSLVKRIGRECPGLMVGVRLSVFDSVPFDAGAEHGEPVPHADLIPYRHGFGVDPSDPTKAELSEAIGLLKMLGEAGVAMANLSAGSPYYCPHLQRPALFPPSDGYPPPEDPLVGVCRLIDAARVCKQAIPSLPMVGTGYSYLQEFLPHVAQGVVRAGWIDAVGLGRMVLSYPRMPADVLLRGSLERKQICRTFSDCTSGPRAGLISGCYPLDPYYKRLPQAELLKERKAARRGK